MPARSRAVADPRAAWDDPLTGHLPRQWLPPADNPQVVAVAAEPSHGRMVLRPEEKPSIGTITVALGFAMPEVVIGLPVMLLAGLLTAFSALSARLSAAFSALSF